MTTDHDFTQRADELLSSLSDVRQVVERFSAMTINRERYVAKLERQVAEGERDAELLELLVRYWHNGQSTPDAEIARTSELLKERDAADGLD